MKNHMLIVTALMLSGCASTSTDYSRSPEEIRQQYFDREQVLASINQEQKALWANTESVSPGFARYLKYRSYSTGRVRR